MAREWARPGGVWWGDRGSFWERWVGALGSSGTAAQHAPHHDCTRGSRWNSPRDGAVAPREAAWARGRPYLDPGVAQRLEGGPHVGLQLVLHPREAQQLHLPLQAFHHGRDLERPVVDAQLGLSVPALRADTGAHVCVCARVAGPECGAEAEAGGLFIAQSSLRREYLQH